MITIIAEKPSVARQISRVVGATQRKVGYYGGNGYCVTWVFGHLVQLAMPEAYGIKGFRRESLPIVPDDFKLVIRQGKKSLSLPMQDERVNLSSATCTSTSIVMCLSNGSGSVR